MSHSLLSDEDQQEEKVEDDLDLIEEPLLTQEQRLFLDKVILKFSDSLPINLIEIKKLFVHSIMKWERNHYKLLKYQAKATNEEVVSIYSELLKEVSGQILLLELLPNAKDSYVLKNSLNKTIDFVKKQVGYKSNIATSIIIILFLMFFVSVLTVYAILFSSIFDIVPISYWNFLYLL